MMGRIGGNLAMNVFFGLMSPSIDNWAHGKTFFLINHYSSQHIHTFFVLLEVGGGIGGGKYSSRQDLNKNDQNLKMFSLY